MSLLAAGIAILSVLVYAVIRDYHQDVELMLTVIAVRLFAALGVGMLVAFVVSVVQALRRRSGLVKTFLQVSVVAGSLTAIGTVIVNLL